MLLNRRSWLAPSGGAIIAPKPLWRGGGRSRPRRARRPWPARDVEEALRGVQDVGFAHPEFGEMIEHGVEIGEIRFIGADILRRVGGVEGHAQPGMAARTADRLHPHGMH
jgi:hypothetical protein